MILLISGCNKDKAAILLSPIPIAQETFSLNNMQTVFREGQGVYFVLLNPKPFTNSVLKLQIIQLSDKVPIYGYTIAQGRDIEIDKNKDYATGSFYLYREGYYVIRIFSKDDLNKPLAESYFKIEPL